MTNILIKLCDDVKWEVHQNIRGLQKSVFKETWDRAAGKSWDIISNDIHVETHNGIKTLLQAAVFWSVKK